MVVPWPHSSANKVRTLNVFLMFFFVLYPSQIIPPFWKKVIFNGTENRHGIFWRLIFGPGIFLCFIKSSRDFWGLDYYPHSIIPVTWNPEYPPLGSSDFFLHFCNLQTGQTWVFCDRVCRIFATVKVNHTKILYRYVPSLRVWFFSCCCLKLRWVIYFAHLAWNWVWAETGLSLSLGWNLGMAFKENTRARFF